MNAFLLLDDGSAASVRKSIWAYSGAFLTFWLFDLDLPSPAAIWRNSEEFSVLPNAFILTAILAFEVLLVWRIRLSEDVGKAHLERSWLFEVLEEKIPTSDGSSKRTLEVYKVLEGGEHEIQNLGSILKDERWAVIQAVSSAAKKIESLKDVPEAILKANGKERSAESYAAAHTRGSELYSAAKAAHEFLDFSSEPNGNPEALSHVMTARAKLSRAVTNYMDSVELHSENQAMKEIEISHIDLKEIASAFAAEAEKLSSARMLVKKLSDAIEAKNIATIIALGRENRFEKAWEKREQEFRIFEIRLPMAVVALQGFMWLLALLGIADDLRDIFLTTAISTAGL